MTAIRDRLDAVRHLARRGRTPPPDHPVAVKATDLTLLGDGPHGGRYWTHPQYGELVETPSHVLTDSGPEPLPNLPYVEEFDDAGVRRFRVLTLVVEGTYARLTAPRATSPRLRALDAIPRGGLFRARQPIALRGGGPGDLAEPGRKATVEELTPRQWAPPSTGAAYVEGRSRAATAEAMLERIREKGITLDALPDGRLIAYAPRGRVPDFIRDDLRRAAPLLWPLLANQPPRLCERCEDAPAVVVTEPDDVLLCASCAERGAA